MVDPSAAVGADYRVSIITMADGRVLTGIISARTPRTLTIQTAKEKITLEKGDLDEEHASSQSLMPEGQLQQMTEQQIRDLVAYLMHLTQVPLPTGE
jgi:putative heme-binding domain-containing protein